MTSCATACCKKRLEEHKVGRGSWRQVVGGRSKWKEFEGEEVGVCSDPFDPGAWRVEYTMLKVPE